MKQILPILLLSLITYIGSIPVQAVSAKPVLLAQIQNKLQDFNVAISGQDVRISLVGNVMEAVTIEIYSITGQRMHIIELQKTDNRTYDFSLNNPLRKGLYIIKVSSGNQVIAKKLNVQ